MIKKMLILGLVATFIATYGGFVRPAAAAGICTTIGGSYSATTTTVNSSTFSLNPGDVVIASIKASDPSVTAVGLIIYLNGSPHPFQSAGSAAGGTVSTPVTATSFVRFVNNSRSGQTLSWSVSYGATCGQGGLNFTDGRVNTHDATESAAIYCEADNGVTVWGVINSQGFFAFNVSKTQLDKVPMNPPKNTLIKTVFNIALYRLTTGELQVNAPGNYVFIWSGCPPA